MASWNSHTVQHLTTAAKWSSSSAPRLCMLSSTRAGSVKSEGCNGAPAPWVNPTQPNRTQPNPDGLAMAQGLHRAQPTAAH